MAAKHRNFVRIRRIVRDHRIREVCGVQDWRDLEQFVMQTATETSKGPIRCSIIEDGDAVYIPQDGPKRWTPYTFPVLHAWLHRLMYGYEYQPPPTVAFSGDFELVDRLYAHAPSHVAGRFSDHEISTISRRPIRALDHGSLITLFSNSNLNRDQLQDVDGIVLAPNLEDNGIKARFAQVMRQISQKGLVVGYKPHPRKKTSHHYSLENVVLMPQHVPAELLLLALPNVSFILATKSTALLTSQWICDNISAISVHNLLFENRIDDIYPNTGVNIPNSINEFITSLP
jgi:hypothetical protein